jgi:hypothetical protein
MNRYHIRFNTKYQETNTDLVWRVFENGNEHLVKGFRISVPMFDETTIEHGETKWNVCCEGTMEIIDDVAVIS